MLYKINRILAIIMFISFLMLGGLIIKLNVFPEKYFFPLMIFLFFILVLGIVLSIKIKKSKLGQSFVCLFLILAFVGSCIGNYYICVTESFFSNMNEATEEKVYYVVVKKDSEYSKLEDLNEKEIATFEVQSDDYKKALEEIGKEIEVTSKQYVDMNLIVKDLLDEKVDGLLINSNNKEMLDENFSSFDSDVKVIKKITIRISRNQNKLDENRKGTFNILISGIDTNGDINKVSRSDVNIIMTVNPNTHEILLTNIPRDMYVQLDGTTGLKDKLTHAGIYGVDMSQRTLENFLNTSIPYYLRVNFDSLIQIVDSIGGIDINNDIAFQGFSKYFAKGTIHLNGKQALEYSRERKKMPNGDWTRGIHQEEVIRAILTKVSSSTELLTNYSEILNGLSQSIQTNLPSKIVKKQVKNQLDKMAGWNVYSNAVAGSGYDYLQTYSMPGVKLYVTIPEDNSVQYNSKVINGILNNKKYSEIK